MTLCLCVKRSLVVLRNEMLEILNFLKKRMQSLSVKLVVVEKTGDVEVRYAARLYYGCRDVVGVLEPVVFAKGLVEVKLLGVYPIEPHRRGMAKLLDMNLRKPKAPTAGSPLL